MGRGRVFALVAAAAGLSAIPLVVRDQFLLNILILAHIYAIYVLGWDLLAGLGGQISGGHALSFGSAAYLSAFLSLAGLAPWAVFPLAVLNTTLGGFAVGLLCCRQTGAYLILVTLALAETAHELSLNLGIRTSMGYMLGGEGGIPVASIFEKGETGFYLYNYYWTLFFLFVCICGAFILAASAVGMKMRAVGSDPLAAQAVGLSPRRYRTLAFGFSFIPGGLAGALYGQYMGVAAPSALSLELNFTAMVMSIIGGKGTLYGPVAAAYLLTVIFSWFWAPPVFRLLLYSLILILVSRIMAGGMNKFTGVLARVGERG
ncbi:MAG: branched-chain amino acid ABC transporter permease [Peptococcaceae bacterium]|nr:branched-chain amino acid ABC transporter permease [Peptococcaceae bacterium]